MVYIASDLWKTPSNDTVIWRYMNYKKFSDLILSNRMYFCELLRFRQGKDGDVLEGSIPVYNCTHLGSGYFKIDNVNITDTKQKNRAISLLGYLTAVNCWGIDKREVPMKWNKYAKSKKGIAIKSKILNIKNAIHYSKEGVFIGKVNYINHETYVYNKPDPVGYFMLKDKIKYDWEHEVRLLTIAPNGNPDVMKPMDLSTYDKFVEADIDDMSGINHCLIECDVDLLIDSIYVSPWAETDYIDEIKSLLDKYNLHKDVKKSFYKGHFDKNGEIMDLPVIR